MPSQRNGCINNIKQLSLALQNYHDTHRSFPLASTAPLVQADSIGQYGAVGAAPQNAESMLDWTAGQNGDGYSWIVQCLPFVEENALYDRITASRAAPARRLGKLADAAFAPSSNLNLEAAATGASPYFWSTKISTFVCPSFPGEDDVDSFGGIPKSKVATSNYVALAATHYRSSPSNHLQSALRTGEDPKVAGTDCTNVPYCGNGALPFPGMIHGEVQSKGISLQELTKGSAHTPMIVESREEVLTSWYSGVASYVVAAMPPPNGGDPVAMRGASGILNWTCGGSANCDTALNKGDPKASNPKLYYQPATPHGGGPRIWGPSSRHPGVVVHAFADAHTEGVNDDIDKDVYLQMVQRNSDPIAAQ